MSKLIPLLRKIRKTNQLKRSYSAAYAFVGIGSHSIHNLYPVLDYLHVPIKYIVTKSRTSANLINKNMDKVIGTVDFNHVLNDEQVNGILISATPSGHFKLVKQSLEYGKHVFVEKPPCITISELKTLIQIQNKIGNYCVTGLQKRYSRSISILKKRLENDKVISYNYRFITGPYPEGDPFLELFLHPVDLLNFIFGKADIVSISKTSGKKGQTTAFIQFRHENTLGTLEASSHYTWSMAEERLIVNTVNGIYTMENHQILTFQRKSGSFLSIPREKVFPHTPELQYLYNANTFLPAFANNQIVSQGYFDEINVFINLCENRKSRNLSNLSDIQHSFSLIHQIRKK